MGYFRLNYMTKVIVRDNEIVKDHRKWIKQ